MGTKVFDRQLLREKEVRKIFPISRSELLRRVAEGRFPKPIKLSPRVSVWIKGEVDLFIDDIIAQRDQE